jgi:hypothetical protein
VIVMMLALLVGMHSGQETTAKKNDDSSLSPITAFFKAVSSIMDSGPELWKKIGKYQADRAIQTVATGATNLEIKKRVLKQDILSGKIRTKEVLAGRVDDLMTQIMVFQSVLDKFGDEIDSSSTNVGNQIRAAAAAEMSGKGEGLQKVVRVWKPDETSQQKSADQLEIAIACSASIASAASCLKNTVDSGKRDPSEKCSDAALEKNIKECDAQQSGSHEPVPTSGTSKPQGKRTQ